MTFVKFWELKYPVISAGRQIILQSIYNIHMTCLHVTFSLLSQRIMAQYVHYWDYFLFRQPKAEGNHFVTLLLCSGQIIICNTHGVPGNTRLCPFIRWKTAPYTPTPVHRPIYKVVHISNFKQKNQVFVLGTHLYTALMCPSPHVNHTFQTKQCFISSPFPPI